MTNKPDGKCGRSWGLKLVALTCAGFAAFTGIIGGITVATIQHSNMGLGERALPVYGLGLILLMVAGISATLALVSFVLWLFARRPA